MYYDRRAVKMDENRYPRRMARTHKGQGPKTGRTQEQRSEATVGKLVRIARQLFARNGFGETSIEDILEAAEVTRGALYHHFDSKTALFKAVFEREEEALAARIMTAAQSEKTAWASLRSGCRAFLEACLDPTVQRIVLRDARSVLALEDLREIESRHTLALLRNGLTRAAAEGAISPRPIDILAHMMLGALSECAMAIARSQSPKTTLKEATRELDTLLDAIAKR